MIKFQLDSQIVDDSFSERIIRRIRQHGVFLIIVVVTTSINLWWVAVHRSKGSFDIDEAGYLLRAFEDGSAISSGGLFGFVSQVHGPDPQAPLLPALAGVLRYLFGFGSTELIGTQQIFYFILLFSTYWLSLQIGTKCQAIIATALVACTPGVLLISRSFEFGLIAAAMFTLALAAQVRAREFDEWGPAVVWGVSVGLAALSRTMILGLLPGLFIGLVVHLGAVGPTVRRLSRAGVGLGLAFLVAFSWYSASWRNVYNYLTNYGYGVEEKQYGQIKTILSTSWWTSRIIHLATANLLAPFIFLFLILLLISVINGFQKLKNLFEIKNKDESLAITSQARRSSPIGPAGLTLPFSQIKSFLSSRWLTPLIAVLWSYLALSSTANIGSYFELTFYPALLVLLIIASTRTKRELTLVFWSGMLVACISFTASSGPWYERTPAIWGEGNASLVALDGRGSIGLYAEICGITEQYVLNNQYADWKLPRPNLQLFLNEQSDATTHLSTSIANIARLHNRSPVVLMATQDAFVNSNTVAFNLFQILGYLPPLGLFVPPVNGKPSFYEQVTLPNYGMPNIVITGPNSPVPAAASFSPLKNPLEVLPALTKAGFSHEGSVRLPGGRILQIWWRDIGPSYH